jgi:hypothetical protein
MCHSMPTWTSSPTSTLSRAARPSSPSSLARGGRCYHHALRAALLPAQGPRLTLNLPPNSVHFPATALVAMSLSTIVNMTATVGFWALTVELNSLRCGRSRSRTSQINTRSQDADGGRARCRSRTRWHFFPFWVLIAKFTNFDCNFSFRLIWNLDY